MSTFYFIAISYPIGMEYQQCGPLCLQTCNFETTDCYSGCGEGYFCSTDKVLVDGECINKTNCPGKLHDYTVFSNIVISVKL